MPSGKLSPKQKRFCEEFLIDCNATQAAIRAGYSEKTARVQAGQMLSIGKVQAHLQELRSEQAQRTQITADRILLELAKIAFAGMDGLLEQDVSGQIAIKPNIDPDVLAAAKSVNISETTTESPKGATKSKKCSIALCDRIRALELLGKHLGCWQDYDIAMRVLKEYGEPKNTPDGILFPHPHILQDPYNQNGSRTPLGQ